MPAPADPKAKIPNLKVFIVVLPGGKEIKVRAESFCVVKGGTAFEFTIGGEVVAGFPMANVSGIMLAHIFIRDKPAAP